MDYPRLRQGQEVVLVGTSGFAVELTGLCRDVGVIVRGCIGPQAPLSSFDLAYLGGDESIEQHLDVPFIVAVGQPNVRRRLFEQIKKTGGRVAGFTHPSSSVSSMASVGEGVIIYPQVTVHAGVSLERGVLVNSNVTVGHETSVGAFSNIGPGVSLGGRARVGEGVYFGIGASMIEEITVANDTVVGAGAAVVQNCLVAGTYVGVPARRKNP